MKRRVLLVGLDGATPAIISQLVDRGELPHLAGMIERGAVGVLAARPPLVRATAWTTLATGREAPSHGVCGDTMVRADGAGVQPTGHSAWSTSAVWEDLASAGHACASICWPATAPATSWPDGIVLDDTYPIAFGHGFDAWSLLPDCVSPPAHRAGLRELRVHPGDITAADIATLVPKGGLVDQDKDARLTRIAVALARTATVHAAATHVLAESKPDFLAVVYPLLASVQRDFLRLRPPRLSDAEDRDVEVYADVVDAAYRLQDAMLGTLLKGAGPEMTVVVVSAYAFAAGADRPKADAAARLPFELAWHRTHGFVAAAGDGIAADMLIHGARVCDVAPTLLNMYGLQRDDHDGRSIPALSAPREEVRSIAAAQREGQVLGFALAKEDRATLEPHQRLAVENAIAAWRANTAEAHLARAQYAEAAQAFESLLEVSPHDWLVKARLARCWLHLGELEKCRALADEVIESQPEVPWGYLLGAAGLILGGAAEKADAFMANAIKTRQGLPGVAVRLGLLHLLRHEWKQAESMFTEAVQAMPRSVEAHDGLGSALLAQERYGEAVEVLRTGIGHHYHYPLAHLHLAMALECLGRNAEAAESARVALSQDPLMTGAEDLLTRVIDAAK